MDEQGKTRVDRKSRDDGRSAYEPPRLVKLSPDATESGAVPQPIEILGIQGPS